MKKKLVTMLLALACVFGAMGTATACDMEEQTLISVGLQSSNDSVDEGKEAESVAEGDEETSSESNETSSEGEKDSGDFGEEEDSSDGEGVKPDVPDEGGEEDEKPDEGGKLPSLPDEEEKPVFPTEGLAYTLSSDESHYVVSGIGEATDTDIVISSTYKGLPVKAIGNSAFSHCFDLTSIVIPEGVTSIGSLAFDMCFKLKEITIPDSVQSIGTSAFALCWELTSVVIPDGVVCIEGTLFSGCTKLTSVALPDGLTTIRSGAFSQCNNLTDLTIPDGVVEIYARAFEGCNNLVEEVGGVAYVGKWAVGCTHAVNAVALRENTIGIIRNTFDGCTHLESMDIPDSVRYVGGEAFKKCSGIIQTEEGISYVDKWAVDCEDNVTAAILREDTRGIMTSTFSQCYALKSVSIPQGVVSIGLQAFYGCSELTEIRIPAQTVYIGEGAFFACYNLTSVVFENANGWMVGKENLSPVVLSSVDLSDGAAAANGLTGTYSYYFWIRTEESV